MDLDVCKAAIQAHGRTNHIMAQAAATRGDAEVFARCTAIANAAREGKLLAPTPKEPNVPELVAAAEQYGLLVPHEATPPDPKRFRQAIFMHGRSCRAEAKRAVANGDNVRAARLEAIADSADGGRLLAPQAGDHHTPELLEAAEALGLVENPPA